MLKIAYFAELFPSVSETWVHDEIRNLQALGCDVRVYSTRPPLQVALRDNQDLFRITQQLSFGKDFVDLRSLLGLADVCLQGLVAGAPTLRLKAQIIRDWLIISANIKLIRDFAPDFLMAHFGGRRATLALLASELLNRPFGIKYHATDVFQECALERQKIARADVLLSISQFNIDFFRDQVGLDVSRFDIHRCGVDPDRFPLYPIPAIYDSVRVLTVARFIEKKGLEDLLDAIAATNVRLRDSHRKVSLEVIGDGPLKGVLMDRSMALGLNEQVRFYGAREPSFVRERMKQAHLFALPCKAILSEKKSKKHPLQTRPIEMDGIPVALMEAMSMGRPVLSTLLSGIPELLLDPETGKLVQPGDISGLSEALEELALATHDQLSAMGQNGRIRILEYFDASKLALNLLDRMQASIEQAGLLPRLAEAV